MAWPDGPFSSLDELIEMLSQPLAWRCVSGELRHRSEDGLWRTQQIYLTEDMYRVEEHAHGLLVIHGAEHHWVRSDTERYDFPLVPNGHFVDFPGSMLARRMGAEYWEAWLAQ